VNIEQLCFDCARALLAGTNITLSLPKGASWPKGFPRGELMSVHPEGAHNVSFDPARVLTWLQRTVRAENAANWASK
jgi:hypothetical protein